MTKLKPDSTKTILTISIGFTVVYLITKWNWAISVSLLIGITGILSNYLSEKIAFLWIKLSWVLSLIVPNILLSMIFYLILFPISLLSRITTGKDPLILRNETNSTFRDVNKEFDKASFEKTW